MEDAYLRSLLAKSERIILVTRQHWFVLIQMILVEVILMVATIIFVSLLWALLVPNPLVALGYVFLLVPIVSALRDFLIWYNHKYVVTNRRVIQVFGVINKNVTDSSLEKVNDVRMDQPFWGRVFNFGDIEILTASELGVNRFTTIGDPIRFKTAMMNAKIHLEDGIKQDDEPQPKRLTGMLEELAHLHQQGILTDEEYQAKKKQILEFIRPER